MSDSEDEAGLKYRRVLELLSAAPSLGRVLCMVYSFLFYDPVVLRILIAQIRSMHPNVTV